MLTGQTRQAVDLGSLKVFTKGREFRIRHRYFGNRVTADSKHLGAKILAAMRIPRHQPVALDIGL